MTEKPSDRTQTAADRLDPASLAGLIAALDERAALAAVHRRVAAGDDPLAIIADCRLGMEYVGRHYESGKYFIGGLIMAGEIFREAMEIIEPLMPGGAAAGAAPAGAPAGAAPAAAILVCTVRGDIHDIGKSILVTLLRAHGHAVHDLGVDVPPDEVARRTLELRPEVVGLSGLLTGAHRSMRERSPSCGGSRRSSATVSSSWSAARR